MAKKPGRPLTREEKEKIDDDTLAAAGTALVFRGGKPYTNNAAGDLVPITGKRAQEILAASRRGYTVVKNQSAK